MFSGRRCFRFCFISGKEEESDQNIKYLPPPRLSRPPAPPRFDLGGRGGGWWCEHKTWGAWWRNLLWLNTTKKSRCKHTNLHPFPSYPPTPRGRTLGGRGWGRWRGGKKENAERNLKCSTATSSGIRQGHLRNRLRCSFYFGRALSYFDQRELNWLSLVFALFAFPFLPCTPFPSFFFLLHSPRSPEVFPWGVW